MSMIIMFMLAGEGGVRWKNARRKTFSCYLPPALYRCGSAVSMILLLSSGGCKRERERESVSLLFMTAIISLYHPPESLYHSLGSLHKVHSYYLLMLAFRLEDVCIWVPSACNLSDCMIALIKWRYCTTTIADGN